MKFSLHFLVLILIFSCNQNPGKQNEISSHEYEGQEMQDLDENLVSNSHNNEEFEILEVDAFNEFLASERPYIKSEVMLLFYPGEIEPPKDDEEVDVKEEILDNGNTLITLIHYNLVDDSIMGYKYLLEMKKKNDKWMLVSAKRNWKFHEGKGPTQWGIQKTPSLKETENKPEVEHFKFLEIGFFNRHLSTTNEELTGKEVMQLFTSQDEEEVMEGNQTETIREDILTNGNTQVTLVRDDLMDDSMKAEQYIMELEKTEGSWYVVHVKTNWKCREGRGHTDWGIELCL